MKRLNLGGGNVRMPGWETVDFYSSCPACRVDLLKFPWPWEDASVDAAAMFHFLEHVEELERTILEVHRILKPGGTFWVIVPHAKHPAAYDISHRHRFTSTTFNTIAGKAWYRFGNKQLFATEKMRIRLLKTKWVKWTPLDCIASRWPVAFEKFVPIAPAHIEWIGRKV
jgi:predicted SAM-dependent methyltransferase